MEDKEVRNQKSNRVKEYLRRIILIICIGVFAYSGYNLVAILLDYQKIDNEYNQLRDVYVERIDKKSEKQYMIVDWQALTKKNKDVIGWIDIPNTNINYPVLHGETNDTYIRSTIEKKYSIAGSIFVDSNNKKPFEDFNTVIYGHNMKNDSMFSDLNEYLDGTYVSSHPYVYMYLPNGTVSKYKIVSAHKIDAYSDLYGIMQNDKKAFYQKMLEGNTGSVEFVQDGTTPLLMLSTCATYDVEDTSRVALHAVLEQTGIDPKTEKMQ